MSDILDRLRGVVSMSVFANSGSMWAEVEDQRQKAAEEIESLRAQLSEAQARLAEIADLHTHELTVGESASRLYDAACIARAALLNVNAAPVPTAAQPVEVGLPVLPEECPQEIRHLIATVVMYETGNEISAIGITDLWTDMRRRLVPKAAPVATAAQAAFVPYTDHELREYYPVMCNTCGWRGLSRDAAGGGPLADTGDYNDICCPKCWADGEGKITEVREVVVVEGAQAAQPVDAEVIAWAYDKLKGYGAGGPGSQNEPLMERLRVAASTTAGGE